MSIKNSNTETILESIKTVLKVKKINKKINLHEPFFEDTNAFEYLKNCIDTGWVSTAGGWVQKFEQKIIS